MSNIFAGLEDLGFKNVEKVDVYQESDSEKKKQEAAKQDAKKETNEEDLLYDDIGSELKIRQIRKEKAELLQSLELYYKVFFLGEDVEG